jgi:hypothetical protein
MWVTNDSADEGSPADHAAGEAWDAIIESEIHGGLSVFEGIES